MDGAQNKRVLVTLARPGRGEVPGRARRVERELRQERGAILVALAQPPELLEVLDPLLGIVVVLPDQGCEKLEHLINLVGHRWRRRPGKGAEQRPERVPRRGR